MGIQIDGKMSYPSILLTVETFCGNTYKPQLYSVDIFEKSLLFSKKHNHNLIVVIYINA